MRLQTMKASEDNVGDGYIFLRFILFHLFFIIKKRLLYFSWFFTIAPSKSTIDKNTNPRYFRKKILLFF